MAWNSWIQWHPQMKNIKVHNVQSQSWLNIWRGKASFSMLIAFCISGKKGMTDRKSGMTSTTPNSKNYLQTSMQLTVVLSCASKTQMSGWTGIVLAATEFCDFLCARYYVAAPNLHSKCDSFSTSFGVRHRLICIKGWIFIACYNKVCDELLCLYRRAFPSSCVHREPLIH